LGGSIKSLGDWVKTSARCKGNTSISIGSIEKSRISISITLALSSTGNRNISSIDTGSTLQTKSITKSIGIPCIPSKTSISIATIQQLGVSLS